MKATRRQHGLIGKIEKRLGVKFTGFTIEEATVFITKHFDDYQIAESHAFDMIYNENHY